MKKLLLVNALLTLTVTLAGCGTVVEKLLVKPQIIERPKLELVQTSPVTQLPTEWLVITRANSEQKFAEIEAQGGVVTLFALTPQGYQNLSMNVADLRRYMQQQNSVLAAMKKYYDGPSEAVKPPTK